MDSVLQDVKWIDPGLEWGNWFAGFVDGEGCFFVWKDVNGLRWSPRFQLKLRDDDSAILYKLKFGLQVGSVSSASKASDRARGVNARDAIQWNVAGRACLDIVFLLNRYPLRTKKQRDFELWSDAVRVYCEGGGYDPRLPVLKKLIEDVRQYRAANDNVPEPANDQQVWPDDDDVSNDG